MTTSCLNVHMIGGAYLLKYLCVSVKMQSGEFKLTFTLDWRMLCILVNNRENKAKMLVF